jgi:hypothetical protein
LREGSGAVQYEGVFVCVASVGEAYMGAYESFKAAQVHLARTLDAELEGTGVIAFTIGPGLVRTPSAEAGIAALAPLYGKTVEEFYAMSEAHIISAEAAGAGFVAAIALASRFRGQEIGSAQALQVAGIALPEKAQGMRAATLDEEGMAEALALCRDARRTLAEQAEGWKERSLFERQWMVRDFKRHSLMTVEQWLDVLERLERGLKARDREALVQIDAPLEKLAGYYGRMQELARGYEKDAAVLEEHLQIVRGWQETVEWLDALMRET